MTTRAGRRDRLNCFDRTLRIDHRIQRGQRQVVLLRIVDMAQAVACVGGRAPSEPSPEIACRKSHCGSHLAFEPSGRTRGNAAINAYDLRVPRVSMCGEFWFYDVATFPTELVRFHIPYGALRTCVPMRIINCSHYCEEDRELPNGGSPVCSRQLFPGRVRYAVAQGKSRARSALGRRRG